MNLSDRRYPKWPIVGVGGILLRNDSVLLVERGRQPLAGYWSLPGGALEVGERLEDAVRRELREETGLDVKPLAIAGVFERVLRDAEGRPEYHYVLIDYLCTVTGGELRAADDARRAAWTAKRDLPGLPLTPGLLPVIEEAFRMRAESR